MIMINMSIICSVVYKGQRFPHFSLGDLGGNGDLQPNLIVKGLKVRFHALFHVKLSCIRFSKRILTVVATYHMRIKSNRSYETYTIYYLEERGSKGYGTEH